MAVIPIADVLATERLPVDAQDVITRVRLVIIGTPGGNRDPDRIRVHYGESDLGVPSVAHEWVSHFPLPLVYEYEAPEHAQYQCTRALGLPEGFNPFLPPADESIPDPTAVGMSDSVNVRDGDPGTYSEGSSTEESPLTTQLSYSLGSAFKVAGYKLRYALTIDGSMPDLNRVAVTSNIHIVAASDPADQRVVAEQTHTLLATEDIDTPEDLHAFALHDARGSNTNYESATTSRTHVLRVTVAATGNEGHTFRVHEFYPLILNEGLLEDVARANIRLPATNPARVTVRGYVAPDREHTIVGWPGGDFTAEVAQHQYELDRTIIDFEQAGAPVGLPAEAIESARERASATLAAISSANYALKMGERR